MPVRSLKNIGLGFGGRGSSSAAGGGVAAAANLEQAGDSTKGIEIALLEEDAGADWALRGVQRRANPILATTQVSLAGPSSLTFTLPEDFASPTGGNVWQLVFSAGASASYAISAGRIDVTVPAGGLTLNAIRAGVGAATFTVRAGRPNAGNAVAFGTGNIVLSGSGSAVRTPPAGGSTFVYQFAGGQDAEPLSAALDESAKTYTINYDATADHLQDIANLINSGSDADATLIYGTSQTAAPEAPGFTRPFEGRRGAMGADGEDATGPGSGTGLSAEQVRDLVGMFIRAGTGVTVVHDDDGNTLTISSNAVSNSLKMSLVNDAADFATLRSDDPPATLALAVADFARGSADIYLVDGTQPANVRTGDLFVYDNRWERAVNLPAATAGTATDLSAVFLANSVRIQSSTGDPTTITAATASQAGVMSATDKQSLDALSPYLEQVLLPANVTAVSFGIQGMSTWPSALATRPGGLSGTTFWYDYRDLNGKHFVVQGGTANVNFHLADLNQIEPASARVDDRVWSFRISNPRTAGNITFTGGGIADIFPSGTQGGAVIAAGFTGLVHITPWKSTNYRLDLGAFTRVGNTINKATNAHVDAVTTTTSTLAGIASAARASLDDTAFTTVRKVARLLDRVIKPASNTVRGVVLLARNQDVDATETDTSRVVTVATAKRLAQRVADPDIIFDIEPGFVRTPSLVGTYTLNILHLPSDFETSINRLYILLGGHTVHTILSWTQGTGQIQFDIDAAESAAIIAALGGIPTTSVAGEIQWNTGNTATRTSNFTLPVRADSHDSSAGTATPSRDHERISRLEELLTEMMLLNHSDWHTVPDTTHYAIHIIPEGTEITAANLPGYPWATTKTVPSAGNYIILLRAQTGRGRAGIRVERDDDAGDSQEIYQGGWTYAHLEQAGYDYYRRPADAMAADDVLTLQEGSTDAHTRYLGEVAKLTEHEGLAHAHQDSPERVSTLDVNAPVGRQVYLDTAIAHPSAEHIFHAPLEFLDEEFYALSVGDFSSIGGPTAATGVAAYPAILNAARISGIWRHRYGLGHINNPIYVAVRGSIGTPTHLHISGAYNQRFPLTLDPDNPTINIGGIVQRVMRTESFTGLLFHDSLRAGRDLYFSLEYAAGYLDDDGTIDAGVDHAIGHYESIGNGQWSPRPSRIIAALVANLDDATDADKNALSAALHTTEQLFQTNPAQTYNSNRWNTLNLSREIVEADDDKIIDIHMQNSEVESHIRFSARSYRLLPHQDAAGASDARVLNFTASDGDIDNPQASATASYSVGRRERSPATTRDLMIASRAFGNNKENSWRTMTITITLRSLF